MMGLPVLRYVTGGASHTLSFLYPPAGLDYVPGGARLVTFQPPGDSVLCTAFEIIDDQLGLEGEERFVVHLRPEDGDVQIGSTDQATVTIWDDDGGLLRRIFLPCSFSHAAIYISIHMCIVLSILSLLARVLHWQVDM